MELEKLRIFLAVAECRSFSLGAKRLYISHSTTSRAVSALDEELGVQLLRRDNRVLGLTPAGECLAGEARRLLRQAEEAAERVRAAGEETAKPGAD
jgi:DNA-binding transcriptional LysR family regulator